MQSGLTLIGGGNCLANTTPQKPFGVNRLLDSAGERLERGLCRQLTNITFHMGYEFNRAFLFLRENGSCRGAMCIAPRDSIEWGTICHEISCVEEGERRKPDFFERLVDFNQQHMLKSETTGKFRELSIELSTQNPISECILSGEGRIYASPPECNGGFAEFAFHFGIAHFAVVPVISAEGEVIGALLADRKFETTEEGKGIDDRDLMHLQISSSSISAVLENAFHARELEAEADIASTYRLQEMMNRIVRHLATKVEGVAIWRTNRAHDKVECVAAAGSDAGSLTGQVMRRKPNGGQQLAVFECIDSGAPRPVNDPRNDPAADPKTSEARGWIPFCHIPLRTASEVFGTIIIASEKPISDKLIRRVSTFASRIAQSMENAVMLSRLERYNSELMALNAELTELNEDLAAVGRGVAHMVRNPLTSIGGFAMRIGKLMDRYEENERLLEQLKNSKSEPGFFKRLAISIGRPLGSRMSRRFDEEEREFSEAVAKMLKEKAEFWTKLRDYSRIIQGDVLGLEKDLRRATHYVTEAGGPKQELSGDIKPYSFEPLDPIALLAQAAAGMNGRRQIDLSQLSSFPPLLVRVDRDRTLAVFSELLSNADKFSPEGAAITIWASLSGSNGRRQLSISVSDSGAGISPDKLGGIFKPFGDNPNSSRLAFSLATSHKTVSNMGGKLSAQSEPGIGSVFTVTLPLLEEKTVSG